MTLFLGSANDNWAGWLEFDDSVDGGGGNDTLDGSGGNDTLFGNTGNDILKGGRGADDLFGGANNDTLFSNSDHPDWVVALDVPGDGAAGEDKGAILDGGSGDDIIVCSHDFSGTMTIIGGNDTDLLSFGGDINVFVDVPPADFSNIVDLEAGSGRVAYGGSIAVSGIENIDGGVYAYSDVFRGDNGVNILRGQGGDDRLEGRGGADTLDGGAGAHDVADYSSSLGVDVDLNRATQIDGDAQGDVLISIEEVDGSRFFDVLRGDAKANYLFGNAGADTLEGRGGADTLDGGIGFDTATYESSSASVNVRLDDPITGAASQASGGDAAGDVLISIEGLIGSDFGDTLTGNGLDNIIKGGAGGDTINGLDGFDTLFGEAGDDTISGGKASDTIDGGFGNDVLSGDDGTDTVSFESWDPTGFYSPALESDVITLNQGTTAGSATRTVTNLTLHTTTVVETDTLNGFENVHGSNRAETIIGNSSANVLEGRGSGDVLQGNGGSDTLDGGTGIDTASYEDNAGRVIVTLGASGADGTASETLAVRNDLVVSTDTLISIENVRGSAFNDIITGNELDNTIDGQGGVDTMIGRAGNDTYLVDNPGDVVGEQLNEGIDTVLASASFSLGANVENITLTGTGSINANGNGLDNVMRGNSGQNTLDGGDGNDEIHGGGDNDFVFGGAKDDTLFGDAGNDRLVGASGFDVMSGGSGSDTFEFRSIKDSGFGGAAADQITDFVSDTFAPKAGDKIDLSQIDANILAPGDQQFLFIGNNNAFSDNLGTGQLRFNGGFLEGDVDGDLVADFRIQVNSPSLVDADFIL